MKTITKMLIAGLALTLTAGAVSAADPEDAIDYRKGVFQVFKWNMGPLGAMAQGDIPFDREMAGQRAEQLDRVADLPWQGFIEGSDMGDTDAMPEVWMNREAFDEAASEFEQASARLAQLITEEASERDIRRQIGAVGQSCKACHDDFRE
ncbi:c-type cytochrome [Ectothiorhodospira marina]|jgi:cytochrome c556|uniref:Cytochrome c556 n=1 Tax=Ectothiorhodospira marina TaxID=1396821 RepID=A0A1H7PJP4_9GAMM|nr:cytochrome c [Ectothiorhodospira marina]SEL35495.1 Cytochrome c556 [Ectothiorhodospira marina]